MTPVRLYLDDIRTPPAGWTLVRSGDEFRAFVDRVMAEGIKITHISFDHDLAEDHYSLHRKDGVAWQANGCDVAKWLIATYPDLARYVTVSVHSMNPVGAENIRNVFRDFYRRA